MKKGSKIDFSHCIFESSDGSARLILVLLICSIACFQGSIHGQVWPSSDGEYKFKNKQKSHHCWLLSTWPHLHFYHSNGPARVLLVWLICCVAGELPDIVNIPISFTHFSVQKQEKKSPFLTFLYNLLSYGTFNNSDRSADFILVLLVCSIVCFKWSTHGWM